MASRYCYDDGVLKNSYDIHDACELEKVERAVSTYRIAELELCKKEYSDIFTVDGYLALHKFIFQDIYGSKDIHGHNIDPVIAGNIRDEAIHKSNAPYFEGVTPFCYPSFIYEQLKNNLRKMKDGIMAIKSREDLLQYISHYYDEINLIHPFREGNGRTLRLYMEFFVRYFNSFEVMDPYEIYYSRWSALDREELLKSSIYSSITLDTDGIKQCYDKVLIKKKSI